MSNPDEQKQVSDAVIVSEGTYSSGTVTLFTASKTDAECLYNVVGQISTDRSIEQTDRDGHHRNYYLELSKHDGHQLEDKDAFDWNTRKVWEVTFEPNDYFRQRVLHWTEAGSVEWNAPRDFTLTPLVCRIIYFTGAHEMHGGGGAYIEFAARNCQKLQAELQNEGIETTNVDTLWRVDVENSKKFREYANLEEPNV